MIRERSILMLLSGATLVSFIGMMLAGVLRTGEAARAMNFVYPYLMFPVAYAVQRTEKYRIGLLCAVFAQAVLMQLVGLYFA
jgi:hypothetical protein